MSAGINPYGDAVAKPRALFVSLGPANGHDFSVNLSQIFFPLVFPSRWKEHGTKVARFCGEPNLLHPQTITAHVLVLLR
jgi:hypothetical protein